jgi:hypothetical protein
MKRGLAILLLLLVSCVQKPLGVKRGGGLFPYGTYRHEVSVHVLRPARDMDLRGVVSCDENHIKAVGLSFFGTTMFRIDEDLRTGEIKKEFFLDAIERHQAEFMRYYRLIHALLDAPAGQSDFERDGARFHAGDFDDKGIPRRVRIEHPEFTVDLKVTKYEF